VKLSPRQLQVLTLVVAGHPDKAIAFRLGLSRHRVRGILTETFTKLGATCRTSAAVTALRRNLIP
jgi:DNA-binding NarL/FixJ family response regulator